MLKVYLVIHCFIGIFVFLSELLDNDDFFAGCTKLLFWPIYLLSSIVKTIIYDITND